MRKPDFEIRTSTGELWTANFVEGQIAVYDAAGRFVAVVPEDADYVTGFGQIKAGPLVKARLCLSRGTTSPGGAL